MVKVKIMREKKSELEQKSLSFEMKIHNYKIVKWWAKKKVQIWGKSQNFVIKSLK